jgi:medium-chain acyl-[acyl-carrier-protein] hydrolase
VGGTAATFRGWGDRLPPAAEVGIVELPGRGSHLHEPAVSSISEAADRLATEIMAGSGYPAVLFGHGLGALVAFEASRRLDARGWPLLALFVSGQAAPTMEGAGPPLSQLPLERFGMEFQLRCDVLTSEARTDPDAMRTLLSIVRADLAMKENYRYEASQPLRCPIVACDALADPQAARTDIDGWRRETTGRFMTQRFGGDRSYIYRESEALTAIIGNHLSVMVSALARSAPMHR